ncbi:MAG: CBS domain-containing protein [Bryobacteraceae bacterium]|nr:CBS domain-containing protein [Bryobacteraceae bacterium]
MTCRELMTAAPVTCTPEDNVLAAAELMGLENVGVLPVVSKYNKRELAGILTDRDIALRAAEPGRALDAIPVGEIMTRHPVTCRVTESEIQAMALMGAHQLRRLPVLDEAGALVGMISMADVVAKVPDADSVVHLLGQVSQPSARVTHAPAPAHMAPDPERFLGTATAVFIGAGVGLAAGAIAMFFADPNRGRTRRHLLKDQVTAQIRRTAKALERKEHHLENKARGVGYEFKRWVSEKNPLKEETPAG